MCVMRNVQPVVMLYGVWRGVVKWYDNEMREMKMCFWLFVFG